MSEEDANALARLGMTADGRTLVSVLFRHLQDVSPAGSESCALHESEGARRFARNLIEKLTRDYNAGERTASEPVGPRPGQPGSARPRGARQPFSPAGGATAP